MLCAASILTILLMAADTSKPSAEELSAYRQARAAVGRDAEAQVKLALWCEAHGLVAERMEHLAMAIVIDPANRAARGLMGLVSDAGRWKKPEDVAAKIKDDAKLADALAEYAQKRQKASKTSEGHWKLALWCEENGLEAEAKAHLTACVRLDPGRTAAWKRLGCKKSGGRWVTDAQIAARDAENEAQRKADKFWKPQLASWRAGLRDKNANKRFEAERGLNSLKDSRAVGSVWKVFVLGGGTPPDLTRAVQLLGQLDTPIASRGLAMIALEGSSPDLRRAAVETLARRDPRDFMGELISFLRDELRYEVRPVGGPGDPGVLFVEGQQFNRMRVYAPPAPNFVYVDTGTWATDAYGFEEIRLQGKVTEAPRETGVVGTASGHEFRHGANAHDPNAAALGAALGPNPAQTRFSAPSALFKPGYGNANYFKDNEFAVDLHRQQTDTRTTETTIPIGRIVNEYRKSAAAAQEQLRQDIATVEAENARIRARNARINEVLNNATNQALPPKGEVWKTWWADKRGYAYVEPPAPAKATFVENVPLAYVPQPIGSTTRTGPVIASQENFYAKAHLTPEGIHRAQQNGLYADCFAAGTPVRTRSGSRPIEQLEVGDHVLSQDTKTGALGYKPILAVFKFRPAETLKISFGGDVLLTTSIHRFWRIGEGWVMARDLKPGVTVRALGGSARVESIEKDVVRQVFNLEVAECSDYFVGRDGILAGDNTMMGPRSRPFDAPEPISALAARTR
ncbi:MAG: hypothetical protein JWN86_2476 [Planctomycetota bacterium]|nr:hypothetical protein [Planctomycetota bacterium]